MDTGYYKFYYAKRKTVWFFFLFLIPWIGLLINHEEPSLFEITFSYFCLFFFIIGIFFILRARFRKSTFLEITPSYVKLYNYEKLYWTDIERIERKMKYTYNHVGVEYFNFWPRNPSKYKLNLSQKMNIRCGYAPFCFIPAPLIISSEELKTIIEIFKEKVPNNNLD